MAFNHFPMAQRRPAIAFDGLITRWTVAPRRHAVRTDPRRFGRGRMRLLTDSESKPGWTIPDDLKLFAATFIACFLFVSILIS